MTFPASCDSSWSPTTLACWNRNRCVGPAHRREGIGRLLFDALDAHLAAGRFTTITAVAVQDSEKFWKTCGFEIGAPYTYPGGAAGHVITKTDV